MTYPFIDTDGFKVFYKNKFEFDFLYDEIFVKAPYFFETKNKNPTIIDCGSHTGMSILYFKKIYPTSKILSFEPDPNNFKVQSLNIERNKIKGDVKLLNVALSDFEGLSNLYGDFNPDSDSIGNTLTSCWGDRKGYSEARVDVMRLSKFITSEISYLKIDTEGSELNILSEIADRLKLVENLYVEVHQTKGGRSELSDVINIIEGTHNVTSVKEHQIKDVLSEKFPLWYETYTPKIFSINAIRRNGN